MKYRAQGVELGVWAFWSVEVGVLRRAFRVSSLELRVDHVFGGTLRVSSRESICAKKMTRLHAKAWPCLALHHH